MKRVFKSILFALMASVAFNAMAWVQPEFTFYFKDFTIKPGETKEIKLYLKNNFLARDFQLQVFFPEGIDPVPTKVGGSNYFKIGGYLLNLDPDEERPTFTQLYLAEKKRLRLLSYNGHGISVFPPGDGVIATLKVKASDTYDGKQTLVFTETPKSEDPNGNGFMNKLNCDTIKPDGSKGVNTYVMPDLAVNVYPAKSISWLLENGVEGGEYGLADAVAVMSETTIGKFIQDAERKALRVDCNTTWNIAGAAAETIIGTYHVTNGNPFFTVDASREVPAADASVAGVNKETTLNNVLFNPEPNEVVKVGGYYRASDNTLCAYQAGGDQGQCISLDWSAFNASTTVQGVQMAAGSLPQDGSYLSVTGPVLQKMTWEEAEQTAGMTGKEGPGAWKNYVIYPTAISTDIPTGVDDINAKTVAGVKYVNTLGVESATPFSGVNIVVTTYTDGSVSAVKVVK